MTYPLGFGLNNEISGDYRTNLQVSKQQANRARRLAAAAAKPGRIAGTRAKSAPKSSPKR